MSERFTRLTDVAVQLPEGSLTTPELEGRLADRNPGVHIPRGMIEEVSGVRRRHVAASDQMASDLAAAAARKLLDKTGHAPPEIDLVIFAGVTYDAVEPATAHLVAAKLGIDCPVFDVRNACNSALNAIEIADAFITSGRHSTILIAGGEVTTPAMRWHLESEEDFKAAVPSYTVSDVGTAMLLEASGTPGVLSHQFFAKSEHWQAAVVPVTRDRFGGFRSGAFTVDDVALAVAVLKLDPAVLRRPLARHGFDWDDMAAICVHQASLASLWWVCELAGIPREKVMVTIEEHGNLAASTLPMQLHLAATGGRLHRGDLVALVGLASGISAGTVLVRW
ncbi:3-oxoacyl-ACP synthase III family protein [Nonomuraea insulae]|uniref:3-oxoacyl-ACP synthase III family protein n=1 Tax=Nonomuraea insulae TaxID=1616787 RepID=A0ABW1CH14_9ACTN